MSDVIRVCLEHDYYAYQPIQPTSCPYCAMRQAEEIHRAKEYSFLCLVSEYTIK